MPPPPAPGAIIIDVRLPPEELVAAWRADVRRLVLETREPLRVQQRVAARITVGGGVAATITGRVASLSRREGACRFELAPDDVRLRALERLLAVARGEPVQWQPRSPRLLASLPAVVQGPAGPTYMTTFSLSENGCGLVWSGGAPASLGSRLEVRLGAGSRAVHFHGLVCWSARAGGSTTVGLRFVQGAREAWAAMLADAERSGAPPA